MIEVEVRCDPAPTAWPVESLETLGQCPICGNVDRTVLHSDLEDRLFSSPPGRWTLYACAACGGAYLDPRPSRSAIHRAYDNYFTHGERKDDDPARAVTGWDASFKQRILRQYIRLRFGPSRDLRRNSLGLAVFLRPRLRVAFDSAMRSLPRPRVGHRLLDIGCGNGRFLAWARAAGWDCMGTEVDLVAATRARARGFDVHLGEAAELIALGEKFHAVTISHVIEHVHDPIALLGAARLLLLPGGFVWIETPNIASHGHACFGHDWRGLEPPRHLQLFHHELLEQLLIKAGFVDVRLAPWQLDWAATLPASLDLAALGGETAMQANRAVIGGELAGRENPAKREFVTFIARTAAEGSDGI